MSEVSLIMAYNGQGQLLLGKRNDNERHTLPGGHLEEGEDPAAGALRELYEETGLHARSLSFLKEYVLSSGMHLHVFTAFVTGEPHGNFDPDREVTEWEFVDVDEGLQKKIFNNLHGPQDEENIVKQVFDMKKTEGDSYVTYEFPNESEADDFSHKSRARFEDDWKGIGISYQNGTRVVVRAWDERNQKKFAKLAEEHEGKLVDDRSLDQHVAPSRLLKKAEDEVARLLDHPSVAERTMALKLDSATPEHVGLAALDHDPAVYSAAIDHPKFGPVQSIQLMEAAAGKDGTYPYGQKNAFLMRTSRIEPHHVVAYMRAARAAGPEQYFSAAHTIVSHEKAPAGTLRAIYRDNTIPWETRQAVVSHPAAPDDVLQEALESGLAIPEPSTSDCASRAVAHPTMGVSPALKGLVERAADRGEHHVVSIASRALEQNACIPAETLGGMFRDLLPRAQLKPDGAAPRLLGALLRNPNATPEQTKEAFQALPPAALQHLTAAQHVRPEDLDRLVDFARDTNNTGLMDQLIAHPKFGSRHLTSIIKKAEEVLEKGAPEGMASHPVVMAQLGFDVSRLPVFRAAKFLAGGVTIPPDAERAALYQEEADPARAALVAYGLPVTEENLAALAAVANMGDFEKSEESQPKVSSVVAAHPEGEDVAAEVSRAFKDRFVFYVALGGKHSKGSMIAYDDSTRNTWLLKSGSGGAGGAAGSKQDPSNPNAREAAWYHIAREWGIGDWFPRAELLFLDGHPYAALKLLSTSFRTLDKREREQPGIARRVLYPMMNSGTLHKWAAMDLVCGNPDRHGQNILVNSKDEVRLIDHGSAFAGPAFDPAHDHNSFVPYYLRAWALSEDFNKISPEEKLRVMPRTSETVARELYDWIVGLDAKTLELLCARYGIDPQMELARLANLKHVITEKAADLAINQLWVTT